MTLFIVESREDQAAVNFNNVFSVLYVVSFYV